MEQQPIEILYAEVRQKIIVTLNSSGLSPAMLDSLLCEVLADIRNQENLEMLNYVKKLQADLANAQKPKEKEGEE